MGDSPGRSKTAEVAGAGLAGLACATALAQRGWKVRVHERASDLRMFGAGIWMWENGLSSLRAIGAEADAIRNARTITAWVVEDQTGREIFRRATTGADRLLVPTRAAVYQSLIDAAQRSGVEIQTNSTVIAAEAAGCLVLEDGHRIDADLIVGADGAHSRVRESLNLTRSLNYLPEGYGRFLVAAEAGDPAEDVVIEQWNGGRRLLLCPATSELHYAGFTCPVDDVRGRAIPPDADTWAESFPSYEWLIRRFTSEGRWDPGLAIQCRAWSFGHVAIVGDAAHAQAPNLAQGANITFTNTVALAAALDAPLSVPDALRTWELRERPLTDHVQRWTNGYARAVSEWPDNLADYRAPILRALVAFPWVDQQINRAARHVLPAPAATADRH